MSKSDNEYYYCNGDGSLWRDPQTGRWLDFGELVELVWWRNQIAKAAAAQPNASAFQLKKLN